MKYLSSEVHVSAKWPKLPHLQERVREDRYDKVCVLITGSFPSSKRHDDEILSHWEKLFWLLHISQGLGYGMWIRTPYLALLKIRSRSTPNACNKCRRPRNSRNFLRLVILRGSDALRVSPGPSKQLAPQTLFSRLSAEPSGSNPPFRQPLRTSTLKVLQLLIMQADLCPFWQFFDFRLAMDDPFLSE